MSALAANSSFLPDTISQSPPKPSSPVVASSSYSNSRSFMNLKSESRAQNGTSNQQSKLLDPIPGLTFAETLKTWSDSQVALWLAEIKCGSLAETFKVNDIRGDVLLELDQDTLKEMNITSIGDRIRILNAIKTLRQRASSRTVAPTRPLETHSRSSSDTFGNKSTSRREPSRPPPLLLHPNSNKGDLPDIIREPDSASSKTSMSHSIRPLPNPNQTLIVPSNLQSGAPSGNQLATPGGSLRSNLPPLPPPPRGQPPPPPSNRGNTRAWNSSNGEAPSYTSQPLPPTPVSQPSKSNGIPITKPLRSTSPLPPSRVRGPVPNKNGGLGVASPNGSPASKLTSRFGNAHHHPYASAQATTLHPPTQQNHNLSPIEETFSTQHSSAGTPSPPSQTFSLHRPPGSTSYGTLSLDDLKRKLVKFVIDKDTSFTIDIANCTSGTEIIEKVLKKIGKGGQRNVNTEASGRDDNDKYLNVDGWAVYRDPPPPDSIGEPLTEVQLLAICHAPDHPARERGLIVRRIRRVDDRSPSPLSIYKDTPPGQTSKATKRASSISVLSGLGVRNPERALSDPPSPSSENLSPSTPWSGNSKRPSKLRNFFGQRPPSELITDHLPEFFPFTEKKVLKTARQSMLVRSGTLAKRLSTASSVNQALPPPPPPSRFSTSTQGSFSQHSASPSRASVSSVAPTVSEGQSDVAVPRMSLSTDDGHSVDLHAPDGNVGGSSAPQLLPPLPLGTDSFSESMEAITGASGNGRPVSRAISVNSSSKRLSYMSELRSKRDRSDTASLMTVDEITAEVESRRGSKVPDMSNPDLDDWTKVEGEDDTFGDADVARAPADGDEDEDEDGTLATEDDDEDEEVSEDEFDIAIPTRTANKWIKGALIGAGSFGKVYLGMDASNGLLMAVKQVELPVGSGPNQERKKSMLSALEREIELLKNLQHENIVQYLYSSIDEEFLNIFLEYVPGGSVATLLQNYGAFEEPLVRNFVRQILQGLDYLHERDIIHRDIKGANILVDNKGGVKISDFGISKKADDNLLGGNRLHRPSLQGSVFWMAPEVVKQTGHTKKADIWSVGCLVVEMLTGEHPWAQLNQMQAIFKIGSSAKPGIPADISAEAQDFLQRTFEINHEARPSASELLQHPWIAKKSKKSHNAAAAAAMASNDSANANSS